VVPVLVLTVTGSAAERSLGSIGPIATIHSGWGSGTHAATSTAASAGVSALPVLVAPGFTTTGSGLSLGTAASPTTICGLDSVACNAGTGITRVTLTSQVTGSPKAYWPDVQIAFVMETTGPDGDEDHYNSYYGTDPCAASTSGSGPICEESNGVPFMIQNAQSVANAIASANPHSNVSFAMTDFYGTDYDWNDGPGDSWKYHVDIPSFIPASELGSAVHSTFQAEQMDEANGWGCICGLDDNFLHSSAITGLYGTIIGSGLDWSPATHHVIVLMLSAAPRDPAYLENYWVSSFDHCCSGVGPYGGTCEPAYQFSNGASPNCEGWVRSQDGNANDSIAGLTKSSPSCTESVGGTCTIDVIDYWDTPTDPYSKGWPTNPGYSSGSTGAGPGGSSVIQDSAHILEAGCDLAAATGGTWNGPSYWTCPNGQSGSLQYVEHGSLSAPNTNNPTLFTALKAIGFGPQYQSEVANGTGQPIFTYVPPPNFALAPSPQYTAACVTPSGFLPSCQTVPSVLHRNGVTYLGWNWSTNASRNTLYVGDSWTSSFNIVNTGPPYALDPVLACDTIPCRASSDGGPINGIFSAATYDPPNSTAAVTDSFPLAQVHVIGPAALSAPPIAPPAAPPVPPGIPIVTAPATPVLVATPTLIGQGIGTLSLQAAAAGFLGAGFMRVGMKNRPIAMKVAAKSGAFVSKFGGGGTEGAGVGRFE